MSSKCLSPVYDLHTFGFTDVGRASFSKTRSCFSPTTPKFLTQGLISIRRDCALRATPKPFGESFSSVEAQKFRLPRAYSSFGRILENVSPYISRYRLTYFRVLIEVKWLMRLSQIPEFTEVPNFSEDAQSFLQGIIGRFSTSDAFEIMDIEDKTNEGVEAVEYFLKQKCRSHPEIAKVLDFFYFPCACDINELAYTLMLRNALYGEVFPSINALIEVVCYKSKSSSSIPMLSRTNGQTATATATTLGKEMANFAVRLNIQKRAISQVEIMVRFAGTAGNYNAHIVAYPSINWPQFAEEFVTSLGVGFNPYGAHLESTDHCVPKILDAVIGFNSILTEFCEYLCGYVSLTTKAGQVGSYTMSDEDFSDSKRCLRSAWLDLSNFKLTDSGVLLEAMGVGLENSITAYTYAALGIERIWFREAEMSEELNQTWEVLAEAIQTVMGRYGVNEPYEKLKELTSGRIASKERFRELIEGLELPEEPKLILLKLTPLSYVGPAVKLARMVDMAVKNTNVPAKKVKMVPGNSCQFEHLSFMSLLRLDGQYWRKVMNSAPFMSEYGLIYFRVLVEIKWLLWLSQLPQVTDVPSFSESAQSYLQEIIDGFSIVDALEIQRIEKGLAPSFSESDLPYLNEIVNEYTIIDALEMQKIAKEKRNHEVKAVEHFLKQKFQSRPDHDVKAVDHFLKQRFKSHPEIAEVPDFFLLSCKSENINNLAHALMLKGAMTDAIFPVMDDLIQAISNMAKNNAHIPMLSLAHGQHPSATTLGKEMATFAVRLGRQRKEIFHFALPGIFACSGHYNAVTCPDIDWPQVAEEFVTSLGLSFSSYLTDQIEPLDNLANAIVQFNKVLIEFDKDIWQYRLLGYFKQMTKSGETGSSAMPGKVNPIDSGKSVGKLVAANKSLRPLRMRFPIAQFGDSADSIFLNNWSIGIALKEMFVGLGNSLKAYNSALQLISELEVNEYRMSEDLNHSWLILAEPIKKAMQRYGVPEPDERLKVITAPVTKESARVREFVKGLELPDEAKANLLKLTPDSCIGAASELAMEVDSALNVVNELMEL